MDNELLQMALTLIQTNNQKLQEFFLIFLPFLNPLLLWHLLYAYASQCCLVLLLLLILVTLLQIQLLLLFFHPYFAIPVLMMPKIDFVICSSLVLFPYYV